jgi:hypothetical protein
MHYHRVGGATCIDIGWVAQQTLTWGGMGAWQVVAEEPAAEFLGRDPRHHWLTFQSPPRPPVEQWIKTLTDSLKWTSMGWWRPLVISMVTECRFIMANESLVTQMKVAPPPPPPHRFIMANESLVKRLKVGTPPPTFPPEGFLHAE